MAIQLLCEYVCMYILYVWSQKLWILWNSVFLTKIIEYILEGSLENPSVWVLSVPFSLKGSSKCTNHVNVHKLYAVEYINTVCSLDYSFRIFYTVK